VGATVGLLAYTLIFAHLGHWYVSLPVFGAPVLILAVVVKVAERRDRRRAREDDTSRLRVLVSEGEDGSILTVNRRLDYPALLDVEAEIGAAVRRSPRVLLDLSKVTSVEAEAAWSVTEIVNDVGGADVAVLIGSDPALRPLRDLCALEGVTIADDVAVADGAEDPH